MYTTALVRITGREKRDGKEELVNPDQAYEQAAAQLSAQGKPARPLNQENQRYFPIQLSYTHHQHCGPAYTNVLRKKAVEMVGAGFGPVTYLIDERGDVTKNANVEAATEFIEATNPDDILVYVTTDIA